MTDDNTEEEIKIAPPRSKIIEYDLNPSNDMDKSKVSLRLDPSLGARIRWHGCDESVANYFRADHTGLAKLERMILALEITKKHILASIEVNIALKHNEEKEEK